MRYYTTYSYHATEIQAELALIRAKRIGAIAECEKPVVARAGREYAIRVLDLAAVAEVE